jgi:hypothetical protein
VAWLLIASASCALAALVAIAVALALETRRVKSRPAADDERAG